MTYTVRVTREGTNWLGAVEWLTGAHSYARSLRTLHERMREVVALVQDLPDGAESSLEFSWDYSRVDPEAVAAAHLAEERAQLERARERIASDTRRLVIGFIAKGWSSRDIAAVLGLSPGRISQLGNEAHAHAT